MAGKDPFSVIDDIFGTGEGITKDDASLQKQGQTGTVVDTTHSDKTTGSSSETGSVTAAHSTQTTTGNSTVRNLSADEIASLDQVLKGATGSFNPADLSAILGQVSQTNGALAQGAIAALQRAQGGDAALAGTIDPILAKAKGDIQLDIQKIVSGATAGAGSAFNSIVAKVGSDAAARGDVALAATGAQLAQANRLQVTNEITAALQGLSGASSTIASTGTAIPQAAANIDATRAATIANISNILKGAVSTSDSISHILADSRNETQSTTNSTSREIGDTTDTKNVNLNTTTSTLGHATSQDNSGLLKILLPNL